MDLTEDQINRYARHIVLKEVGGRGQQRLLDARVLCVGAGGLGCPLAIYLAAAGVGTIGIIDYDAVDLSNLHRQILHQTGDVGRPKVESLKEAVEAINPDVSVECYGERLTDTNIKQTFEQYDVIVDGTDNFPTRYLIADACYLLKKPLVTASVFQFEARATTIIPGDANPCYRCLYPEPPTSGLFPSCAEAGVLGMVVGTMGSLQAIEALKVILGVGENLVGTLLTYDSLAGEWYEISYGKSDACPLCGKDPTIREITATSAGCRVDNI